MAGETQRLVARALLLHAVATATGGHCVWLCLLVAAVLPASVSPAVHAYADHCLHLLAAVLPATVSAAALADSDHSLQMLAHHMVAGCHQYALLAGRSHAEDVLPGSVQ